MVFSDNTWENTKEIKKLEIKLNHKKILKIFAISNITSLSFLYFNFWDNFYKFIEISSLNVNPFKKIATYWLKTPLKPENISYAKAETEDI